MRSRLIAQLRMFLRMTGLTLLWCVAVGVVNLAAIRQWPTIESAVSFLVDCTKAGAVLGLITVTVAVLFGRVRNPLEFKAALAVCICALPALLTFMLLILFLPFAADMSLDGSIIVLALLSNLPFAYWLSQIVARKYLREISPEKPKGRPTAGGALSLTLDAVDSE